MATKNDELAASVGQDKQHKDGALAYDAKMGVYAPKPKPNPNTQQAESTVKPFGSLSK